ncbi:MAG: ATP-binding protein [Lachnospiraceae bacterium]|nr:ATP-binding protein [Lachnospiraceae bacterium]
MNQILSNLLVYGKLPKDSILWQLSDICAKLKNGTESKDTLRTRVFGQVKELLVIATDYAFDRNLWHNYLTFLLITNENPFSLVCEKTGAQEGTVNYFVKHDFEMFRRLFAYDFSWLEEELSIDCFMHLTHYTSIRKKELMYNKNVSEKVRALSERLETAADAEEFFVYVTDFYRDYGVGMFGLNKAFRIAGSADGTVRFLPINNMDTVMLGDLIGYELQKKKLVENTRAFVEGGAANNVLLFGDSGTGKSTSIKAIVNQFYPQGLRMIEIYKHQFKDLSAIIAQIKNRNYRFIIYMDDLSFEEFEIEYKFLKAVIEGGVETKPDNILIYATSNRRHLIKETGRDRDDMEHSEDLHRSDTMEEKLSLVNRFGLTIYFAKPNKAGFNEMAVALARRAGISAEEMTDEEICYEANRFEMRGGGLSGRTAQQFANYLLTVRR